MILYAFKYFALPLRNVWDRSLYPAGRMGGGYGMENKLYIGKLQNLSMFVLCSFLSTRTWYDFGTTLVGLWSLGGSGEIGR